MKTISLDDSIHKIVSDNPEITEILTSLGFDKLNDKKMFNTVARVMTLRKAARMHNITYDTIHDTLNTYGFTLKEDTL